MAPIQAVDPDPTVPRLKLEYAGSVREVVAENRVIAYFSELMAQFLPPQLNVTTRTEEHGKE